MTDLPIFPTETPIVFWDETDPGSVINLVPDQVRACIKKLSKSEHAELLTLTETDLYRRLQQLNQQPNPTDNRLRIKFWLEYARCHETDATSKIIVTNITAGVCSRELFYKHYITNLPRLAWMLCPPTSFTHKCEEALSYGVDQVRKLLELEPEKMTKSHKDLADMKMKLIAGLEQVIRGTKRRMGPPLKFDVDVSAGAGSEKDEPVEITVESTPAVEMTEAEAEAAYAALLEKNKNRPRI